MGDSTLSSRARRLCERSVRLSQDRIEARVDAAPVYALSSTLPLVEVRRRVVARPLCELAVTLSSRARTRCEDDVTLRSMCRALCFIDVKGSRAAHAHRNLEEQSMERNR